MNKPAITLGTLSADAIELLTQLRAAGESPAGKAVIRSLERALPEASAEVREALANPAQALGSLLAAITRPAVEELADSDRALARGLAKAFGRGVLRGAKKNG